MQHTEKLLRFVVQHHLARKDHYDFRLEWNGVLLSWAVPKGPSYNPADKRLAIQVEDHPLDYRNFEGTIPKGEYGGGTVMLWDEGNWNPAADADKGLKGGILKFNLNGKRLKGSWALVRFKNKDSNEENNWMLLKENDEYAKNSDGISQFTTSIRSGRTMREIENGKNKKIVKNPFRKVNVQLAKLVDFIPQNDEWLYELKYDGYRIVAFAENGKVRLATRNNLNFTTKFKTIAKTISDFACDRAMVLDGEMVIIDETGKTDFQALQNYMRNNENKDLTYVIFDILALDGTDLRNRPLIERKSILADLLKNAPQNLYYSQHIHGQGKESFDAACKVGLEGVIGKKTNSVYSGTRNADWIKLKCRKQQEFVIGGYTLSDKKTKGVSSLLLGYYENGKLIYCGRSGTGLTDFDEADLENKFKKIMLTKSPFANAQKVRSKEQIFWLTPLYIAEIQFAEWTEENLLRQASYKGLRKDKNPIEVKKEMPE